VKSVTMTAKSRQFTADETRKGQFLQGNRSNLAEERVVRKSTQSSECAVMFAKTGATLPFTHFPCPLAPTIAKIKHMECLAMSHTKKMILVRFGGWGVQGGVDGHEIRFSLGGWFSCDEQKDHQEGLFSLGSSVQEINHCRGKLSAER